MRKVIVMLAGILVGVALVGVPRAMAQSPYGYPSPYGGCSGGSYGGYALQGGYGFAPQNYGSYGGGYPAPPAYDYSAGYGYGGYAPPQHYGYAPPAFYNRSDVNVYLDQRRRFFPSAPVSTTRGPT
jgi:hypothetical protein